MCTSIYIHIHLVHVNTQTILYTSLFFNNVNLSVVSIYLELFLFLSLPLFTGRFLQFLPFLRVVNGSRLFQIKIEKRSTKKETSWEKKKSKKHKKNPEFSFFMLFFFNFSKGPAVEVNNGT